jgi:hypothetical protein
VVAGVLGGRADGDRVQAPQLHRHHPGVHQLQAGEELAQLPLNSNATMVSASTETGVRITVTVGETSVVPSLLLAPRGGSSG